MSVRSLPTASLVESESCYACPDCGAPSDSRYVICEECDRPTCDESSGQDRARIEDGRRFLGAEK